MWDHYYCYLMPELLHLGACHYHKPSKRLAKISQQWQWPSYLPTPASFRLTSEMWENWRSSFQSAPFSKILAYFCWQNVVANRKDASGGWISCHPCTLLFRNDLFLLDYWNFITLTVKFGVLPSQHFFLSQMFAQGDLRYELHASKILNK